MNGEHGRTRSHIGPTPDSASANLQPTFADLQRRLAEARAERDEAQRRLVERTAERDESEAQKAAMAEVMQVINSSPGDLAPVFDAILDKAHTLCGAEFGSLFLYDGEHFRAVASHGVPEALASRLREGIDPGPYVSRLMQGEPLIHIDDVADVAVLGRARDHPITRAAIELGGVRTRLLVALRKEDAFLGYITAYRQEVRPFTDKQIALLQNFAAQAVIAMENARLLTETREALEQQTATAEVLQVINSSPGDLSPVFEAMLEKALRLCETPFGYFLRYDGEAYSLAAAKGLFPEFLNYMAHMDQPVAGDTNARVLEGEAYVHVVDLKDTDTYRSGSPLRRANVDLGGFRSALMVPLRKDDRVLGTFCIGRREVRPFTDKQIALLQNVAAQAVIAMENARLITETHEALERQTATAEVLQVINSASGNLTPVFDAILEKAMWLCQATCGGLSIYDGMSMRIAAGRGYSSKAWEAFREYVPPVGAISLSG